MLPFWPGTNIYNLHNQDEHYHTVWTSWSQTGSEITSLVGSIWNIPLIACEATEVTWSCRSARPMRHSAQNIHFMGSNPVWGWMFSPLSPCPPHPEEAQFGGRVSGSAEGVARRWHMAGCATSCPCRCSNTLSTGRWWHAPPLESPCSQQSSLDLEGGGRVWDQTEASSLFLEQCQRA